ncbi:MAG: 16S rRNA (guanine(527)-N(7))-methyltransferase RsmG [Oscillospiraceae bacterium]|nr:16S rRNA (guanine(527)-N(7))-methyltransferase RsmG [Oscillospiraceae bacterium]
MLEQILKEGFREYGLPVSEDSIEKYRRYCGFLLETNKVMNLTSIEGEDDTAKLHFLDCAALLKYAELEGKSLIDVGTGAGFPGLALKIVQPDIRLTLLDSLDKRIGFLKKTCEMLGLEDVECIHARAEEIPAGFRENFDAVASRAVARLNVLAELCLPYVKEGGIFIAMKGPEVDEELDEAKPAIKILGGKTEAVHKYTVSGTDIIHSAIIIRKISATPGGFPRKWAQIKKKPM